MSMAAPGPAGRFAPSPTGPLHFGSLVAAVASYADARQSGARWRLRIDDVDVTRARADAARSIVSTLGALGFRWDGEVARQRDRTARYAAAFAALARGGALYPCRCTRADARHWRQGGAGEPVYPGTCRPSACASSAAAATATAATPGRAAWRLRVDDAVIAFDDRVQGRIVQNVARDVGDFVVKRSDGLFAYQLAIVVDDADDAISDVVRGADLVDSTPRQRLLQRLLGFPAPRYAHVPVAVAANGEKLSKQSGAPAIDGAGTGALLAAWAFLGQAAPPSPRPHADAFWAHATTAWSMARVPPMRALPCPPAFA